jgi:hypothetical protein
MSKDIPAVYEKYGYIFRLLQREDKVAIYSQSRPGSEEPAAFEVVRVRFRAARQTPHCTFEAGYHLPSAEEWGRQGWTFPTLRLARDRLASILATPPTKQA